MFSGGVAINKDSWAKLPPEVQQAMREAGAEYSRRHGEDLVQRHQTAMNRMVELGKGQNPPKAPQNPPQTNPNGGGEQDIVPPLAQLKVLRSLQAELNDRTAEFAKAHPDPDKLTDEEKAELRELEQSQREIAELFEQMAKLFEKKETPPNPEKP